MPAHDPVVVVRSSASAIFVIAAASLVLGCSASSKPGGAESAQSDAIRAEFEAYVDAAKHCEAASDCVGVTPGCPLPCMVAVRVDRKTDVLAKAQQLRDQLTSSCEATCPGPGPATCAQNRCQVVPATAVANPSVPTPPNEAGGGPFPGVQLDFQPSDGSTGVGTQPLAVAVFNPSPFVTDVKLAELAAAVSLVTWPEKQAVDARVEPGLASTPGSTGSAAWPRVVLTPAAPLQSRWYAIRMTPTNGFFQFNSVPGEPQIGARFRPDPQPQVIRIDFCTKDGAGMKLVLSFSEALVTTAASGDRVSVEIDGKPAVCNLYDRREAGLYFTCADLKPASLVKVTVAAGLQTPTGVPLAPGAWTIDLSTLTDSSCRTFRLPL
jgi:hypothetical protein